MNFSEFHIERTNLIAYFVDLAIILRIYISLFEFKGRRGGMIIN